MVALSGQDEGQSVIMDSEVIFVNAEAVPVCHPEARTGSDSKSV